MTEDSPSVSSGIEEIQQALKTMKIREKVIRKFNLANLLFSTNDGVTSYHLLQFMIIAIVSVSQQMIMAWSLD